MDICLSMESNLAKLYSEFLYYSQIIISQFPIVSFHLMNYIYWQVNQFSAYGICQITYLYISLVIRVFKSPLH